MTARYHHYLPQCYLAGFAAPRKKGMQVITFDRATREQFQTNVRNVAQERDFNRVEIEGLAPDVFEASLATFESELGPTLRRVHEAGDLRVPEDRNLVMNFIAWVAVHNPRLREQFRSFTEDVANRVMDLATASPERWESQLRKARAAGYLRSDRDMPYSDIKRFLDEGEYTVQVPNERHIVQAMKIHEKLLPIIADRNWWVLLAQKESAGFVTCDQPISLMWSDPQMRGRGLPLGYGLEGTQVFVPLTSRVAIVGAFELEERVNKVGEGFVAEVNAVTILNARRQVYARDLNFTYITRAGETPKKASRLLADRFFLRPDTPVA